MSTRWRYYNSKRGSAFRGRGRGQGKKTSLTAIQLPRDDIFQNGGSNNSIYKDRAMDPIDYTDETVLCLSFGQNMIGAAIYEQSNQLIKIMNDISEDHEFRYLDTLIEETKPTMILANKSQDLDFLKWLGSRYEVVHRDKQGNDTTGLTDDSIPTWNASLAYSMDETTLHEESDDDDVFEGPMAKLHKLPNSFFKMPRALDRLKTMMGSADVAMNEEDKHTIVAMRFDIDAVNMIKSLGALLFFLDETRLGVEREPLTVCSPIKSIKSITISHLVDIDFNTIQALDILPKENEKKKYSGICKSLYSLVDGCRSTLGKKCLRKWFRNPTTDRDELVKRQRCVQFFKQDWNAEVTMKIAQLLGKVKPQNNNFLRFQNGSAQLIHWEGFIMTVTALVEIVNIIKHTSIASELHAESSLVQAVSEIAIITGSIINFAESKIQGRVTVMPGIDAELDKLRETYNNMSSILTGVAKKEADRLGIGHIRQVACVYVPLVGFILSLPRDFPAEKYPDMSLVYATSEELRVRNATTERLDEEFGDILMKLVDKQTAIILSLKAKLMKKKRSINKLLSLASRIDALVSLGLVAAENGWNCPSLMDDPVIEATELFHPISALVVKKQLVPNPVSSGRNGIKVSVITGPNACGKSVYMKSIGILVFLTHIGSFVPARHAKVGLVDRIVTRMFTVDSVLDGMSTFAKDVEQVAFALRKATSRSLVIIDEFGKGTMTEVGLSLLVSCLTYWMKKGFNGCPHIFLASHFHALPNYLPIETNLTVFLTFTVLREPGGKIKYLFQLISGIVDCSFAMAVAKQEGIPISVLGRACRVYKALKSGTPLKEVKAELTNREEDQHVADMNSLLSDQSNFLASLESFINRDKVAVLEKEVERSASRVTSRSIVSSSIDQLSLFDALLPPREKRKSLYEEEAPSQKSSMIRPISPDPFESDQEDFPKTPTKVAHLQKKSANAGLKRSISPSLLENSAQYSKYSKNLQTTKEVHIDSSCRQSKMLLIPATKNKTTLDPAVFITPRSVRRKFPSGSHVSGNITPKNPASSKKFQCQKVYSNEKEIDPELTQRSMSRREVHPDDTQLIDRFTDEWGPISPVSSPFSFLNSQSKYPNKSPILESYGVDMFNTQETIKNSSINMKSSEDFIFKTPMNKRKDDEQRDFRIFEASHRSVSPSSFILGELSYGHEMQTPLPRGDTDNFEFVKKVGVQEKEEQLLKSDDEDEEFLKSLFESEKSSHAHSSAEKTK